MFVRWIKILAILMASGLTACSMMPDMSGILPDRKVDYKKEKQAEQDLEIPPDLTKSSIDDARAVPDIAPSGATTYSDYVGEQKHMASASEDLTKNGTRKYRSQLLQEGGRSELEIAEAFPRAWRITGMALDRGGFAVEDRDRDEGIYYVRYNDPTQSEEKEKGILSKLAFWRDDHDDVEKERQYQVRLQERGETTRVTIQDSKGVRSNSDTAKRILGLLHEQIK